MLGLVLATILGEIGTNSFNPLLHKFKELFYYLILGVY